MKALPAFAIFLKEKIVKVHAPDKSRAEFLLNEAVKSYAFLQEMIQKIELRNENANEYIKICHDVILELIRARMLWDGFHAVGPGAHEAEVSYLRVLGFKENEVQFVNQLRFFRNGMLYYGTMLDKEYAQKVSEFTQKNFLKFKELAAGKG